MIKLDNVTKIFGAETEDARALLADGASKDEIREKTGMIVGLRKVALEIAKGELFMVMGLSGSGKSTLVRLLNRLIEPTLGSVSIDGENLAGLDSAALRLFRQNRMSMVFQSFALLPHRSVAANVAYGLELKGIPKEERLASAERWIARVGLEGFETVRPDQLSGGMCQRVGLARALATETDILLMDEPFSALDPLIRREMQELLFELQQDLRKTIVFITHDLGEALALGDRIAVLKDGAVAQVGAPDDITERPATDYVRKFVDAVNAPRLHAASKTA